MKGSDKQVKWAEDILRPAINLINQFPEDLKVKHLNSINRINNAISVINQRNGIADWCERVRNWLDTGTFTISCYVYDEPSVIRTIIV